MMTAFFYKVFNPKCPLEQFEKKVIILIHQFSNGHH